MSDPTVSRLEENFMVSINGIIIEATVTNRGEIATSWIHDALFSDEHRPMIVGIERNAAAGADPDFPQMEAPTLNLCCGNRCLVFSLLFSFGEIPDALADFLLDRDRVMLVGIGIRRIGDWLGRPEAILVCRDPWELGEARAWRGLRRLTSLDQLAERLLGREMGFWIRRPDQPWDRWPLTHHQVADACLQPYLLSRIAKKLLRINRDVFQCCNMCTL